MKNAASNLFEHNENFSLSNKLRMEIVKARAWTRLPSGRHLDLIHPMPDAWLDSDLSIRLSRVPRWSGESSWPLPLSVAQHSLSVWALRRKWSNDTLSPHDALRELLHDAEEGFLGFDCASPLKPIFGESFAQVCSALMAAVNTRYHLQPWTSDSYVLHKRADNIIAATEAIYCAGWSFDEMRNTLGITEDVLIADPLVELFGGTSWEPWTSTLAATRFQLILTQLMSDISNLSIA